MDKLSMGNYGGFVWTSFALAFLVVFANEWFARRRHRLAHRDIEVLIKAVEERP